MVSIISLVSPSIHHHITTHPLQEHCSGKASNSSNTSHSNTCSSGGGDSTCGSSGAGTGGGLGRQGHGAANTGSSRVTSGVGSRGSSDGRRDGGEGAGNASGSVRSVGRDGRSGARAGSDDGERGRRDHGAAGGAVGDGDSARGDGHVLGGVDGGGLSVTLLDGGGRGSGRDRGGGSGRCRGSGRGGGGLSDGEGVGVLEGHSGGIPVVGDLDAVGGVGAEGAIHGPGVSAEGVVNTAFSENIGKRPGLLILFDCKRGKKGSKGVVGAARRIRTSNNGAELQGGGSSALEQLNAHGSGVGRDVVPCELVVAAGGDDLVLCGRRDGVEAGGLGADGRDEGQKGGGGDGELHFWKMDGKILR